MDLEGSCVVLLGGTSGIGFATVVAAAERGAEVTVRSGSPAGVERALAALPTGTRGQAVDLNDPAQVQSPFAGLDLDHLICTAGEPLALMPVAELDLARPLRDRRE